MSCKLSLDFRCHTLAFNSSLSACFTLYGSSSSASCLSTFIPIPRYKEGGFLHWLKSSPSLITCSPLPCLYVVLSLGYKSPPFPGTIIPAVPAFNLPSWPLNVIYRPVSWTLRYYLPWLHSFLSLKNLVLLSLATLDPFLTIYPYPGYTPSPSLLTITSSLITLVFCSFLAELQAGSFPSQLHVPPPSGH